MSKSYAEDTVGVSVDNAFANSGVILNNLSTLNPLPLSYRSDLKTRYSSVTPANLVNHSKAISINSYICSELISILIKGSPKVLLILCAK